MHAVYTRCFYSALSIMYIHILIVGIVALMYIFCIPVQEMSATTDVAVQVDQLETSSDHQSPNELTSEDSKFNLLHCFPDNHYNSNRKH